MNTKRIAAVIGLVFISIAVLSIVLSAFMPAYHELTLSIGGVCFLLAVTVLAILKRPGASENDQPSDDEQK